MITKTPIIFRSSKMDISGSRLIVTKAYGDRYFYLRMIDKDQDLTIKLDFIQINNLIQDIIHAEQKEIQARFFNRHNKP